jgi:hypothetical protein
VFPLLLVSSVFRLLQHGSKPIISRDSWEKLVLVLMTPVSLQSRVLSATCSSKAVPGSVLSGGLPDHGGERKSNLCLTLYSIFSPKLFIQLLPVHRAPIWCFDCTHPPRGSPSICLSYSIGVKKTGFFSDSCAPFRISDEISKRYKACAFALLIKQGIYIFYDEEYQFPFPVEFKLLA